MAELPQQLRCQELVYDKKTSSGKHQCYYKRVPGGIWCKIHTKKHQRMHERRQQERFFNPDKEI